MTCFDELPISKYVEDRTTSYHDYQLLDKNGDELSTAEVLKYKLSDGLNALIDWTNINPPVGSGEIEIDGDFNTPENCGLKNRFLSIYAANGGEKKTITIRYVVKDSFNISEVSP